ncbi:hypothetical protein MHTCC0001_29450 [Flavobacteriaceae bacterium MHTCC 0001]
MILISKYIVPKGYISIALFPFIFLNKAELKSCITLINHEKIHLRQQLELLVIPFYLWYGIEFFIKLIHYKNWDAAYKAICFEREAYDNETHIDYLSSRPVWGFLKYLRH